MNDLGTCCIRLKCDCGILMKVKLQQISNEKIITCTCGMEYQLIDGGGNVRKMITEDWEERQLSDELIS